MYLGQSPKAVIYVRLLYTFKGQVQTEKKVPMEQTLAVLKVILKAKVQNRKSLPVINTLSEKKEILMA